MTTWLFIGPSLLAGIGQVTKRYADLVDGEYVEIGHPPKKSRYDRGFAFVLPIENQLVVVDQYAQICTEMMYMTVCETEPVNPAYGILARYKTIWCPSEFAQSTLASQFPETEWKLLRHWAPERPHKAPEATTPYTFYTIGNIADPGLLACKEIADFPVLGLCETSSHIANLMGANFGFVTINDKFTPKVLQNVQQYGLGSRCVGARRMSVDRILDLNAGYTDAAARQKIIDEFLVAGRRLADEDGAEVVIAAGGVAMALLEIVGLHEVRPGVPILNGVTALVKAGEMAVKTARLTGGRFISKRLNYARPAAEQIAEIRKYYGEDVYPTIPGGKV